MSDEIKVVYKGYEKTVWMHGNKNDNSYFICEYRKDSYVPEGNPLNESVIWCAKFEKELESKDACNLDCEEYGYCETCRGFSAVGCQVCEIPRAARKEQK